MRVCHVVASLNEHTGGPAYSVTRLADALHAQDIDCSITALNYPTLGKTMPSLRAVRHIYEAGFITQRLRGFSPRLRRGLVNDFRDVKMVHNHGLWMFPNLYARQAALIRKLPYIISPRGMLEEWSLNRSRVKKWVVGNLFERKNLVSANVLHATSEDEYAAIRAFGLSQPVAVVPNGVDVPALDRHCNRDCLERPHPELKEKKWLLFFSRMHPKKGLENLVNVWRDLEKEFSDWHLIISGPDLIGFQPKVERRVRKFELTRRVTFTGMLKGEKKRAALQHADLFVLPTHSENFGIVVGDALAHGTPAITTKSAPWRDLETYGWGWWTEDDLACFGSALQEALLLSPEERREMGRAGRALIQEKYSWPAVAARMAAVYRWMESGGTAPECIFPGS